MTDHPELRKALEPFAMFALEGKNGGGFIIAKGLFEDMKGWDDSPPRSAHLHKDDFLRARQALASTPASSPPSGSAPDGYVLVPREPWQAMLNAADDMAIRYGIALPPSFRWHALWAAMLAAAPPAPSSAVDEGVK